MAPAADVYMIIANLLLSGNVVSINPEESLAGPREQLVAQVWSSFERCRHYNLIIVYFLYNDCRILNIYIFILIRWKECSHPMRGPEKLDLQIPWYNFVSWCSQLCSTLTLWLQFIICFEVVTCQEDDSSCLCLCLCFCLCLWLIPLFWNWNLLERCQCADVFVFVFVFPFDWFLCFEIGTC